MTEFFDKSENNLIFAESTKVLWYRYNLQKMFTSIGYPNKITTCTKFLENFQCPCVFNHYT